MTYDRVCAVCGRDFVAHHASARYCSKACKRKVELDSLKELRAKRRARAVCADCGRPIPPPETGRPHKRCDACTKLRDRELVLERRAEYRSRNAVRRGDAHDLAVERGSVATTYRLPKQFEEYLLARAERRNAAIAAAATSRVEPQ